MSLRASMVPLLAALVSLAAPAMAQNYQNWDMNQQNQINQSLANGTLNGYQAQRLQNRDAQIMAQQQAYMNQNGGFLTRGESRQIRNELSSVQRGINHNVGRNMGISNFGYGGYGTGYGAIPVSYSGNYNYRPNGYGNYNLLRPLNSSYTGNWGYRHHWH